ncbi:MAG: CAP domain-containing protein [Cyclobacteriaceae bacterium]|nr:hypothetical protein [Cyclobacteriaceae bacterium]MCH8515477.1 CAP domain-containing protein [Cyclobacteriaceae bacterium]
MLKHSFVFTILVPLLSIAIINSHIKAQEVCLSEDELDLYEELMEYRNSLGLSDIPLSAKLTKTAQVHMQDLLDNYEMDEKCNPHSWSAGESWEACCYTSDHKNAECMWLKPLEIADYNAHGYEIVYFHSLAVIPTSALESWKKSPGHHHVMINKKIWEKVEWKAVGLGIRGNWAAIWFGEKEDETVATLCDD